MHYLTRFLFALCLFFLPSAIFAQDPVSTPTDVNIIMTPLINNKGNTIGVVTVGQAPKGVLIYIIAEGLPPGPHGMHFHKIGNCKDYESFKASGGHIGSEHTSHGLLNTEGPHAGNLPNLHVHKDGTVEVELYSNSISLRDDSLSILDSDGSALIIHAEQDNHKTQPIGGAGDRIACASLN